MSTLKAQIEAGHYINDSQDIRDLIRREQKPRTQIEAIRAALMKAKTSAEPRPQTLRC